MRQRGTRALTVGAGLALLLVCASGCREPAEVLAEHFEAMALIAESREEDCGAAAAELEAYLEAHATAMREAAGELGKSSQVQARRIHVASRRLDAVVEQCRTEPGMTRFTGALSELVLEATGLGR